MTCDCCGESYSDPNDLAVFGTLVMAKPLKRWKVCGPCIQVMWRERAPKPEAGE